MIIIANVVRKVKTQLLAVLLLIEDDDVLRLGRFLSVVVCLTLVYIYKIGEQSSLRIVQLTDHRQFTE